jgi:hypothetical protein
MNRLTGDTEFLADCGIGYQLLLKLEELGFGDSWHDTFTPS